MTSSKVIYEFAEWRLDAAERLLLRNGKPVPLAPKVFATLLLLVENAGHLVTKDEFMKRVRPDTFVEDVALAQNISQLRKTLASASENRVTIETVSKRGYRLLGTVRSVSANGNASSDGQVWQALPSASLQGLPGDGELPNPEESARLMDAPAQATSILVRPAIWSSRAVRIVGFLAVALALIALLSFEDLRHGRAVRAAGSGHNDHLVSGATTLAGTSIAPKILPLISLPGEERMPAFSPDGSRVAFVWRSLQRKKSGVYAVVVGSQSLLRLTNDANDIYPAWSPDGRYVAFLRNSGDKFSLHLVPALGGTDRLVYTGARSPWVESEGLSFSPDGKLLAFAEWDAKARQSSIESISLDGSGVHSLTSPPTGYHDTAPAFSPDGERLAFVRSTGPVFLDEIYVVRLAGGEPTRLTFDHHRVFGAPLWTPDGQEILFASNRAGLMSLWRIPASGGTPQSVPGPGPAANHPSISSSGGELAYEYSVEDENLWRVELHNATHGLGPARGLFSSKTSNLMPQFSPDGRKIAFEGDRSGYEEIWVCDADGSNPEQVTRLERFSGTPRWSPDGRYLVFDSRREQHSGIYSVDLSDGLVRSIATFSDADSVVPSWSRDGRWIYFASDHGGKIFHVWKAPVSGGLPVQVTKNSGFAAFESPDGRYVFYAGLSEPGIWRVPRDGGPESLYWRGPGPDNWGNWALAKDGIYFIESKPGAKSEVERLDFKTRQVSPVATLEHPSFYGLTVAPEATSLIYSQRDRDEHDVVMTRIFR